MTQETPEDLLKHFESLDPGEEDGDDAAIHYADPTTARKGLRAARMLLQIQKLMNISAPARPEAPAAEMGSKEEIARLNEENEKLRQDAARLRDHIRLMQRQIDRIYDRREMTSVLERIEGGKAPEEDSEESSPAHENGREEEAIQGDGEASSEAVGDSDAVAPAPATDEADVSDGDKKENPLRDMLDAEGAAPLSAEEKYSRPAGQQVGERPDGDEESRSG